MSRSTSRPATARASPSPRSSRARSGPTTTSTIPASPCSRRSAYALTELAYRVDFPDGRPADRPPTAGSTSRRLRAGAAARGAADPSGHRARPGAGARRRRPGGRAGPGLSADRRRRRGSTTSTSCPVPEADPAAALAAVRRAFHADRNLCEDVGVAGARRAGALPARGAGRDAPPPPAGAGGGAGLRPLPAADARPGAAADPLPAATRRDVLRRSGAALEPALADPDGGAASLDAFFADAERRSTRSRTSPRSPSAGSTTRAAIPSRRSARGEYRELVLPSAPRGGRPGARQPRARDPASTSPACATSWPGSAPTTSRG